MDAPRIITPALGSQFKVLRRRANRTQAEVAAHAGCTQAWVSRFELGDAPNIGAETLALMYDAVGHTARIVVVPRH